MKMVIKSCLVQEMTEKFVVEVDAKIRFGKLTHLWKLVGNDKIVGYEKKSHYFEKIVGYEKKSHYFEKWVGYEKISHWFIKISEYLAIL